jgi:hypothetical protein
MHAECLVNPFEVMAHRIFADRQAAGYRAVAQPGNGELENLLLTP